MFPSSVTDTALATIAGPADSAALVEAILLNAQHGSGGVSMAGRDVGDVVPLSEQWMLILLRHQVQVFPIMLVVYRLRCPRAKSVLP